MKDNIKKENCKKSVSTRHTFCLILAGSICLFALAGCRSMPSSNASRPNPISPVAASSPQNTGEAGPLQQDNSDIPGISQEDAASQAHTGTLTENDSITGRITAVEYAGSGNLFVCADSLYLYDEAADQILGEFAFSGEAPFLHGFFPIEGGYALFGEYPEDPTGSAKAGGQDGTSVFAMESAERPGITAITDNQEGLRCWLFDEQLTLQKSLDLHGLLREQEYNETELSVSISRDGTLIAVCCAGGKAYLYHMADGTFSLLAEADSDTKSGIFRYINPTYIHFTEQSGSSPAERLLFTGIAIPEGQSNSVPVYGTMNADGSELNCQALSDYALSGEMIAYENEIWFPEDFQYAAGKLFVTDPAGQKIRLVQLEGGDTGADGIFGSDTGEFIATIAVLGDISQWNGGWRLQIYDAESGKIVWEQNVGTDTGAYNGVSCNVRILDGQRECIVTCGRGQNTDTTSYFF